MHFTKELEKTCNKILDIGLKKNDKFNAPEFLELNIALRSKENLDDVIMQFDDWKKRDQNLLICIIVLNKELKKELTEE